MIFSEVNSSIRKRFIKRMTLLIVIVLGLILITQKESCLPCEEKQIKSIHKKEGQIIYICKEE